MTKPQPPIKPQAPSPKTWPSGPVVRRPSECGKQGCVTISPSIWHMSAKSLQVSHLQTTRPNRE